MTLSVPIKQGFEDQILDYLIKHLTGKAYPLEIEVNGVKQPNPLNKEDFAEKALQKFVSDLCIYQYNEAQKPWVNVLPPFL
ncbi:MAG: hypothetical protein ING84_18710 [Cytophagales bacterium]|nr:hypothetical protein [Cytophagales bacterium]MCA6369038.1 hypothetical protein [Cytophagales bacterium]MCA6373483.1 hypothetical protein [Cytophagales bacterium]MCA6375513.1 hypothetical protein [Cytophagales bacterium]MCA6385334.1 hypothetical protein [Cytophagales bacterium]